MCSLLSSFSLLPLLFLLLFCIFLAVHARALRATFSPLSPTLSLFSSLSFSPTFLSPFFFRSVSLLLSLWQSRFYHVAILFMSHLSDIHTHFFLFRSIELFIIEFRRDLERLVRTRRHGSLRRSPSRISTSACEGRRVAHFIHFAIACITGGIHETLSSGPLARDRLAYRILYDCLI